MSLIYFHIFLIATAAGFGFFLGIWEFKAYNAMHQPLDFVCAISSCAAAVALVFYLVWFIKNKKPFMK